jgi:alpha-tubulin suppressor-like RCC1 family protein
MGPLGYGNEENIGDNEPPSSAGDVDLGGTAVQIAAGGVHTCARLDTGGVRCWGYGGYGMLGYANTDNIGDDESPASVGNVDVGGSVIDLAAGYFHTCAVLEGGSVRCWGAGVYGALGYGNGNDVGDNETPAFSGDVDVGEPVSSVTAGYSHTCALLESGAIRCWGSGAQLGYGNSQVIGDNETPASAGSVMVGGVARQMAAGDSHTCAVLETNAVRCWGDGTDGQLGYANTATIGDDELPFTAGDVLAGAPVSAIATGNRHTCALLESGDVRCWGYGTDGRLGYGNPNPIGDDESPASAGAVPLF